MADSSGETGGCRSVLVVEDDPASRRALVSLLKLNGVNALYATTFSEAMRLLETHPECVLLDLMLPDGTGGSILEFIRSRRLPIRVAFTTGAADWRQFITRDDLRPDAIFIKPLDFDSITRWLGLDPPL